MDQPVTLDIIKHGLDHGPGRVLIDRHDLGFQRHGAGRGERSIGFGAFVGRAACNGKYHVLSLGHELEGQIMPPFDTRWPGIYRLDFSDCDQSRAVSVDWVAWTGRSVSALKVNPGADY